MQNVMLKLAKCRHENMQAEFKKKGYNNHSKYAYFTPEQINEIVLKQCHENQLFTKYDLKRNELGTYGTLDVICLETMEQMTFEACTEIPSITATNAAQQNGGAMTFNNRYLLQFAFGISDNSLDPDSKEGDSPKQAPPKIESGNPDEIEDARKLANAYKTPPRGMKKEYAEKIRELLTPKSK